MCHFNHSLSVESQQRITNIIHLFRNCTLYFKFTFIFPFILAIGLAFPKSQFIIFGMLYFSNNRVVTAAYGYFFYNFVNQLIQEFNGIILSSIMPPVYIVVLKRIVFYLYAVNIFYSWIMLDQSEYYSWTMATSIEEGSVYTTNKCFFMQFGFNSNVNVSC